MRGRLPGAANALTALRLLLAPAFAGAVHGAPTQPILGIVGILIFAVCAASDVVDGRLARRLGTSTNHGRTFDHLADIVFLLAALGTYAWLGIAPWWVPGAVAASFAFYVGDSWLRTNIRAPSLIGSRIGHAAGVMNYVVVGVLVFDQSAGLRVLPERILTAVFWMVPLYSAVAVAARLAPTASAFRLLQLALRPAHVGEVDPGERQRHESLGDERH